MNASGLEPNDYLIFQANTDTGKRAAIIVSFISEFYLVILTIFDLNGIKPLSSNAGLNIMLVFLLFMLQNKTNNCTLLLLFILLLFCLEQDNLCRVIAIICGKLPAVTKRHQDAAFYD